MNNTQIAILLEIFSFLFVTTDIYDYKLSTLDAHNKIIRIGTAIIISIFFILLSALLLAYVFGVLTPLHEPTGLRNFVLSIAKYFMWFGGFVIVIFMIQLLLLITSKFFLRKKGYFIALGILLFLLSKFVSFYDSYPK